MGMGSGQKIHDGGSEEMVKDTGVGGGGARWMACLGEVWEGEGKGGALRDKAQTAGKDKSDGLLALFQFAY